MHEQYLLVALDQAWLGRGRCAPNPSVGAVAVHKEKIIAQTWHRGAGTPHAEQLLISQLPKNRSEITLYVTLEPCNHWGKTPPCVDAIIDYGIKKVVYGYRDPNPMVMKNNTTKILNEKGVEVLYFPMPEITEFYRSYHHWVSTQKPWLTVKIAQTFDGKIAGPNGARVQLSNALCDQLTHKQRLHSDILLTTARTINNDDPQMNVRLPSVETAKPVAIITGKEQINSDAKVFKSAEHCHIYHDENFSGSQQHANCTYHAMPSKQGKIDLVAVIAHLGSLGFHDVFAEVGGTMFSALHAAHLVNKTFVYLVPSILGEQGYAANFQADIFNAEHKITWQPMQDNMIASLDWVTDEMGYPCSQE